MKKASNVVVKPFAVTSHLTDEGFDLVFDCVNTMDTKQKVTLKFSLSWLEELGPKLHAVVAEKQRRLHNAANALKGHDA